ncbi:LysR family transcriptional regulator [Chitiniphilus shinanonensis]|uniref:LysR family transcriptional regulator n=1 Tax=Chitiniphilus shinanonensis TaxID=553088 RepID=A0ABQ6BT33_9NEIS|nr:LysR family transcriptional regulator [Chitiniphilus shinanonensis]GLS04769.1 LysR family transcriptional regulator [Chitiniphilus shinanonensis]
MHDLGRIDLTRLALFVAVVDAGGFTAAAERLGLAKAAVSQQVARLERDLGVTLLTRTTRRVTLTEAGEAFYGECVPLLRQAETVLEHAAQDHAVPQGTLRVTASVDYAASVVAPLIAAFATRHPTLQIELIASNEVVDLVEARIDVAIRQGWLRDSTLRAVQLGSFGQWLLASPAYLARAGAIARPEELSAHRWIALNLLSAPLHWQFEREGAAVPVRMRAPLRVNSPQVLRALLLSDAGVSVLPDYMAHEDVQAGRLVRLLPQWELPRGGIYAVYPASRHLPAKSRAFIDFVKETGVIPRL